MMWWLFLGTGFTDAVSVKFGEVSAAVNTSSATSIATVVPENPAATDPVNVVVTNNDGKSVTAPVKFTYNSDSGADELDWARRDQIKHN